MGDSFVHILVATFGLALALITNGLAISIFWKDDYQLYSQILIGVGLIILLLGIFGLIAGLIGFGAMKIHKHHKKTKSVVKNSVAV